MTEKKKKDGRGGYRPGAGRKPIGDRAGVYIAFRVPEEVRDEIRALSVGGEYRVPYFLSRPSS